MCRDIDHAGNRSHRRCSCDTSAARQARRIKARARTEYSRSGEVAEDITLVPSSAPPAPEISVERVRQLREEVLQLDADYNSMPSRRRDAGADFTYELEGEAYTSMADALLAINAKLEQKTIEAGSVISALAAERSGIAQGAMQEYWMAETARLKEIIDADERVPFTPEQEAQLAQVKAELVAIDAEMKAYSAAHRNDYPSEYTSGFFGDVREHLRNHPEDAEAKAKLLEFDEILSRNQSAATRRRELEGLPDAHLREAQERYRSLNSEYGRPDPQLAQMMSARAEAMREVLAEVREMGGVELAVVGKPQRNVGKVLQAALRYYPKDWIEASNRAAERRPLRVKSTGKRAHYSDGSWQRKVSRMPSFTTHIEDSSWEPDPNFIHDHGAIVVKPDEHGTAIFEAANGYTYESHLRPNEVMVVRREWQVHFNEHQPTGKWQKVVTQHKDYRTGEMKPSTSWVRQKTRSFGVEKNIEAELTISGGEERFQEESGYRVALHEFAHRVESTSPERISRIEAAFLERRRAASASGGKEELTAIYTSGKREVGYEDEFVSRYMGKVYEGQRHREVLSTGMEALFSGSYGGLAGTAGRRRDDDMQHLVLGLLATA